MGGQGVCVAFADRVESVRNSVHSIGIVVTTRICVTDGRTLTPRTIVATMTDIVTEQSPCVEGAARAGRLAW